MTGGLRVEEIGKIHLQIAAGETGNIPLRHAHL